MILAAMTLRAVVGGFVLAEAVVVIAGVVLRSVEGGGVLNISVAKTCEILLSVV